MWIPQDDQQLRELYSRGEKVGDLVRKLGLSEQAIRARASAIVASRPKGFYRRMVEPVWETQNINVIQEATCL